MKIQFCNGDKLNVLHFQHNIYDFGNGYCEVLEQEDFYQNLKQYIKRLFELGHKEIILNILNKLETCVIEHNNRRLRFKALGIISDFSSLLNAQKDRDFFYIVVNILTKWLSKEQEYQEGFGRIFKQIKAVIIKMFSLRLWGASESLLVVSQDIISGSISTETSFKRQVSKLHRDIADPTTINCLVESFLESKGSTQTITCNVLKALVPHSSEPMIHGLFKCSSREKRFKFLDMILVERDGVLPVLVEKLKDKQPWYVVRNSMILLGNLQDPDLYSFARPFLCHPDSRVQREVLNCISTLGGENVSKRLIRSFSIINDDVKEHLVDLLVPLNNPAIGLLFVDILKQKISVPVAIREQLIITLCTSGQAHLSSRGVALLRAIVMGGEYVSRGFDPALDAVRKLIKNLDDIDNLS